MIGKEHQLFFFLCRSDENNSICSAAFIFLLFSPSAAVAGDHVQHHRAVPLLPHVHQSLRHLPGPAPVEVQPLLPGQRRYGSRRGFCAALQLFFVIFCKWLLSSRSVPDEFMYNPVSRSYGEPHMRPEVQNSTVEFIASSDYMVRHVH